jgi:glutamine phosphoribosylpyrophosphate amidotransferase
MCGLFGFVGKDIDLAFIKHAAIQAEMRGPHAFGFTYTEGRELATVKGLGKISASLRVLDQAAGCRAIIGHCRLSTSGDFSNIMNNQPIANDQLSIAHNGNVRQLWRICHNYNYKPFTSCDSEAWHFLIDKMPGTLAEKTDAAHQVIGSDPCALLILNQTSLVVLSGGLPMYITYHNNGIYFSSRPLNKSEKLSPGTIQSFNLIS